MKVKELVEYIKTNNLEDFDLKINICGINKSIKQEGYPTLSESSDDIEFGDIGYSDKIWSLDIDAPDVVSKYLYDNLLVDTVAMAVNLSDVTKLLNILGR